MNIELGPIPQLREGIALQRVAEELRNLACEGRNLAAASAGVDLGTHQNNYLIWVQRSRSYLKGVLVDQDLRASLHSTEFWQIREFTPQSPRAIEFINFEAEEAAERLESTAAILLTFASGIAGAADVVVLDTNVLLHYQRPDNIPWCQVSRSKCVHLAVPLRVIEELDAKKYTARSSLAQRARDVLGWLGMAARGSVEMQEHVTIGVIGRVGAEGRPLDADAEILACCTQMLNAGARVRLATLDTGLSLRAESARIELLVLDDKYRRELDAA